MKDNKRFFILNMIVFILFTIGIYFKSDIISFVGSEVIGKLIVLGYMLGIVLIAVIIICSISYKDNKGD